MLSKLYFNEPYTKITRLIKPEIKYFEAGTNQCTLTGTSRKVLVDIKNTSAFISGLNSFESHLKNSNRKICWEVMYLSFFAPKLALYNYTGNYSTLNIFFFDSDNLLNIKNLFEQNFSFYKDPIELRNGNYRSNFKIYKFGKEKPEVFTEKYELSFMLIYTFYKQFLEKLQIKIGTKPMDWNPFDAFQMKHVPINLKTFKADEFSGTIRPNSFETINNFKYLVRLCFYLEKNQVNFYLLLFSLKLIKPSEKNGQNKYRIERLIRNQVLGNIINSKSILNEIEYIFLQCYKILTNSQPDYVLLGIKNYKQLLLLLTLYEPIIKYGGQKDMDNDTQDMAIKLGQTIGFGILEYDTSTTKIQNAKQGKSYIIALKKARTQEQLLDELIRLQSRFNLKYIKNLEWLTSKNFNYVKQFAIISALNILNSVLTPSKFNKNEEK